MMIPLLYGVRYYNTDDVIRRQMLVGSNQFIQDPHLIFSTGYIGRVFTFLYNLFPALEWYLIINSLLIIIALLVLLSAALQHNFKNNVFVSLFFLFFLILVGRDLITHVHFTIVSSLLAVASAFIFSRSQIDQRNSWKGNLVFAFFLLSLALSFRAQSALLAFVFTCFVFISYYLLEKNWLNTVLKRYVLIAVAMLVVAFCPPYIAKIAEHNKYKEFRTAFDNHRALFDFKIQKRAKNADLTFKNAGWKEGHKQIFFTYMLPAVGVFSPSNLNILVKNMSPASAFRVPGIGDVKFLFTRYLMEIDYKLPFFIILLIPICIAMNDFKKGVLWLTISILFYLLVILILGMFLKFPGEYVTTPLLCAVFFVALLQIIKFNRYLFFTVILELFVLYAATRNYRSQSIHYVKNIFKSAVDPMDEVVNSKINLICLSQRSNDYAFPIQYNSNDWWRKADLKRAYYFGPFIWHPANTMSYRKDSSDLVFNSLNSDQYLWILSNGYENDFVYDGFDEAVVGYVKDQYNVDCKFEKQTRTANYTLYKLVTKNSIPNNE